MNPRTIRWQAAVNLGLLLLVAFLVAPAATLWLALPALLWWLFLDGAYAHSLGDQGRPERRMHGDKWVAGFVAIGLLLPALVAAGLLTLGYNQALHVWDFTVNESATILISLAALFVLIICSSLIDWYYVRPRIDGVVCAPPCRSSGSKTWKRPTRWWYLHRGLATLAYFAFALVLALVVMLMLVREYPAAAGVVGGVGGLAGLFLIFAETYRNQIPTVARFVLSPAFCLGDDLRYEAYPAPGHGYVLHVALPVIKIVPLDDSGAPTGDDPEEIENSKLRESRLKIREAVACSERCAELNPECVFACERRDQRRRLLVL